MTSPDPVPAPPLPRAEIVTTDGITRLATDVTSQALTWPELVEVGVVLAAAAVEFDEFVAATMPAPRPPPITSPPASAAQGTQRGLFRPCFDSFISVTWESSLPVRAPVLGVGGPAVITPAGWRRPLLVPRDASFTPAGGSSGRLAEVSMLIRERGGTSGEPEPASAAAPPRDRTRRGGLRSAAERVLPSLHRELPGLRDAHGGARDSLAVQDAGQALARRKRFRAGGDLVRRGPVRRELERSVMLHIRLVSPAAVTRPLTD